MGKLWKLEEFHVAIEHFWVFLAQGREKRERGGEAHVAFARKLAMCDAHVACCETLEVRINSKPTALRGAPWVSLDPARTSSARGRPCVERVGGPV